MDPKIFADSPSGHMVRTIEGAWAFVPAPLPPKIDIQPMLPLLTDAVGHLGELRGIGRTLPNPYILIRPFQRREAVASSGMEGTITSLSDLMLLEAGADEKKRPPDTREVLNYVNALEHSIRSLSELPVCLRMVKKIHEILLKGVRQRHRGANISPGEFRTDQNWIGSEITRVTDARFVPPPPKEVMPTLDALEKYMHENTDSALPLLVRLALIHYQFETIHPFPDGNGRVGRLLIPLILREKGEMPQPLLYMSPYFDRHKDEYVDRLYEISRVGAWSEWIEFFLTGIVEQCRDTIKRVQRLQDLQTSYRERLQKTRASASASALADLAFEWPYLTIPTVQKKMGLSYPGAKNNVEKLLKENILAGVVGTSNPKFFVAHEIFDAVNADYPFE